MAAGIYDLAIIGGGINGTGIARDAAGRGLSVLLCEQNDLGSGTSSASTKLIHGGLRYLEYFEFRLVRESLLEREVILRAAPHIVWPLRFVLPHHRGLRPAPVLRLGLFLYDHLGGRKLLPPTRMLDLRRDVAGAALRPEYRRAFEYSDCWVEDARLVVLNAMDARARGAVICPRTRCLAACPEDGHWRVTLQDQGDGAIRTVAARALVNAAGPWVGQVIAGVFQAGIPAQVRLVKGSHIVVPRLFAHDRAYIFQNADRRIVFAIPYEQDFTLIGTTDADYTGDPAGVSASAAERSYLCRAVSDYLRQLVAPESIVWSYAGVRPLYDDGARSAQAATRDYVLKLEGDPPRLDIFGGKITTYRRLAEHALQRLRHAFPRMGAPWTADEPLPGGDMPVDGFAAAVLALQERYPFLPGTLARRLVRAYGTRAGAVLGDARALADLGPAFGSAALDSPLTAAEIDYLRREEFAVTAEDILWRRSKLGLRFTPHDRALLEDHLAGVGMVACK
ncbi:glycerol-3-phosphate dehydrogenase [Rhodovastum atsumiense]|uniref:Glycerol-3-phosphate dehydrogenase n=1 Tax=Rhodovastum atsumiense TaxID=504468 RepID=A0A5M6ILM0_9PROT|nr:glycerol-3-phosphate dehydrogenase [Rhodovastum atsumiense]KAA5609144.1 glycerol-3-phosphate dehydrogenase [Rhodovastum atsumiense]